MSAYRGPFLLHYLDAVVYPNIPPNLLIAGAVAVCVLNLWILRTGVSVSDTHSDEEEAALGCADWGCEGVEGLWIWWCLFFRIFGLHQARNVKRHSAPLFLGLVSEAPVHRPGNLVGGESPLIQGRAGL